MTDAVSRLRLALQEWNGTRVALAHSATVRDGEWRLAIVRNRRAMQEKIAALTTAMTLVEPVASSDEFQACRKALSVVRTRMAMHQAEWPAVAIRPEDEGYRRSTSSLRQANDAFAQVADKLLSAPRSPQSKEST